MIVTLVHKVCRLLSSPVLLRKFTTAKDCKGMGRCKLFYKLKPWLGYSNVSKDKQWIVEREKRFLRIWTYNIMPIVLAILELTWQMCAYQGRGFPKISQRKHVCCIHSIVSPSIVNDFDKEQFRCRGLNNIQLDFLIFKKSFFASNQRTILGNSKSAESIRRSV